MPLPAVHIGSVIGQAIVFNPRSSGRLKDMDFDALLASIPQLFDLLDNRGVEYVLVGGIAMRVHVAGRNTQDIDLILPVEALDMPVRGVSEVVVVVQRVLDSVPR